MVTVCSPNPVSPTHPLHPPRSHALIDEEVTFEAASQSYLTSSWYKATTLSCEILNMLHLLVRWSFSKSVSQSASWNLVSQSSVTWKNQNLLVHDLSPRVLAVASPAVHNLSQQLGQDKFNNSHQKENPQCSAEPYNVLDRCSAALHLLT